MDTPDTKWDIERAAAWLRKHTWGASGEASPPALDETVIAPAQAEANADADADAVNALDEEIDIAGWPALVAPFYD